MTSWIECACHCHAVQVHQFDDDHDCVFVSLWSRGQENHTGWRQRLRHIWHIVRYGSPYNDEVVLHRDEALRLAQVLTEAAHRINTTNERRGDTCEF